MHVSSADSPRLPTEPHARAPAVATASGGEAASFAGVLRSLGRDLDVGEQGMTTAIRATAGRSDLGPGELIALQVGVYRYGSAIDLASRLVDGASAAVKTVLQGSGS